jgi:hypothetical protein
MARLTATLSFAYVVRGQLLGVPFTAMELCLLGTLMAYVVDKRRAGERLPDPRRMPYFWPLAILLVAATVSIAVAPDKRAAAGIWRAYFVEPMLFAYVIADVMRAPSHLGWFIAGFFWSGILVSVLEILTFLFAFGVGRPNLIDDPVVVIYNSANATGLFLGPLLAMAAALIFTGRASVHPLLLARGVAGTAGGAALPRLAVPRPAADAGRGRGRRRGGGAGAAHSTSPSASVRPRRSTELPKPARQCLAGDA